MRRVFHSLLLLLAIGAASAQITLWTTEEQPERIAVQKQIAADFKAATGITVEVVPVTENLMGERVTAAYAAGSLPDIIYHPLNFTLGWYAAGILDGQAATAVVNALGAQTFSAGALDLIKTESGWAAVPVDGWTQLLLYRKDLFKQHGLEPPTTFARIEKAVRTLNDPPKLYGFVAATDPGQVYMMQVLEEFFLANGVHLLDAQGKVDLDTPKTVETLKFYKQLAQASPPGNLYWQQSRELYFAGKAAMIVWSPFILDELAGLRNSVPITAFGNPTTDQLAKDTGFVTRIAGPSNPQGAGWADVRYYGITVDANTDAAERFVEFSMNQDYLKTLGMAAEGKFPVRHGTLSDPQKFVDGWSKLKVGVDRKAPLSQFYGPQTIQDLVTGLQTGSRWGFARGQGVLVSRIYGTRIVAELVRDYLDGKYTAEETAKLLQQRVSALQ